MPFVDPTDAYAPGLGLQQFVRHLVFLKPDVLIVADEIRTKRESELELRFHPETALVAQGSSSCRGVHSRLSGSNHSPRRASADRPRAVAAHRSQGTRRDNHDDPATPDPPSLLGQCCGPVLVIGWKRPGVRHARERKRPMDVPQRAA